MGNHFVAGHAKNLGTILWDQNIHKLSPNFIPSEKLCLKTLSQGGKKRKFALFYKIEVEKTQKKDNESGHKRGLFAM